MFRLRSLVSRMSVFDFDQQPCYFASANCSLMPTAQPSNVQNGQSNEIDPIWTSSRTARQIYALGEVEKVSGCCFTRVLGSAED